MDDPDSVAIVGIGCKFPGANNIEEFWRVLSEGEDHVQDIPIDRFNVDAFYDANPDAPGKFYMRKAGLVKGFKEWDNQFFGFGESEASQIDPQQRFVLDCVHMSLEDGGITKQDIYGTDTGVYIGIMNDDYKVALMGQDELINNYTVTGTNTGVASARVSYLYNLLGPSIVLDTACSSALVAIHLAASAIKSGDISMAICGGVNCIINPENFISLSKAKMASPTGKSQAFSKDADGYARGEGCGIVILKSLRKALEDNNKIWGTICTGCNQDGRTTSPITAPSSSQQIKLLEKVFKQNNVCSSTIQYIEAHGTGTSVGDPIETNALGSFFSRQQESRNKKIFIGSVKTNIGHLESAAGVAGLIKILLMMEHGLIVQSLHSEELNPKINFQTFNFTVPHLPFTWQPGADGERVACINSFGFGGTNSHAIVKNIERKSKTGKKSTAQKMQIVVLSANDSVSLRNTVQRYIESVQKSNFSLESLSYTSTVRRDHYRLRTYVVAESSVSLPDLINTNTADVNIIKPIPLQVPSVTFVFCGVGTAWQGMCAELLGRYAVFRDTVKRIDGMLSSLTKWSIFEVLTQGRTPLDDPMVNHIAIFTCQIALVHLWRSLGIIPVSIIAQSVGEVAAAYTAGALNLEQAIDVIYNRSMVLADVTKGSMAVVQGVRFEEIELQCKTLESGKADVAVYISSDCCTVSGDTAAIEELRKNLKGKQDIRWIDLHVQCAYHSHLTEKPGLNLSEKIQALRPCKNTIPVCSSVTGEVITSTKYSTSSYWTKNVTGKVKFYQAVLASRKANPNSIYLEIGPSPVLRPHVPKIFPLEMIEVVPSMSKNSDIQQFLSAVGKLHILGVNVNWKNLFDSSPSLADIPKYCFNYKPMFEESVVRTVKKSTNNDSVSQAFLIEKESRDTFAVILNEKRTPYIFEHIVQESIIVPGALYGTIAIEIGKKVWGLHDNVEVAWEIESPLAVAEKQSAELAIECYEKGDSLEYKVFDTKRKVLCRGTISKEYVPSLPGQLDIKEQKELLSRKPDDDYIYKTLRRFGLNHGPLFRIIRKGIHSLQESFTEVHLTEKHLEMFEGYAIHPIIIDSMLQCCCYFLPFLNIPQHAKLLPVRIGKLATKQKVTGKMYIYCKTMEREGSIFRSNAILLQENGIVVAEMLNIETKILNMPFDAHELSLRYEWHGMPMDNIKKSNLEEQMVLISRNKTHASPFASLHCDMICLDGTMELDVAKENILSNNRNLIVYYPGRMQNHMDVKGMYEEIVNDGKTFLKLIQSFLQLELKVVAITEATQNINEDNQTVNLLGSELWGMIRSIAREPTKISFHLIDTYPCVEPNIEAVISILHRISEDDEETPFEICIANGAGYYGSIHHIIEQQHKAQEQIRVFQSDIDAYRNGTLQSKDHGTALIDVKVSYACRNISDTFDKENVTLPSNTDQLWETRSRSPNGISCVEFLGIPCTERRKGKGEVICCYPCPLQSTISVPEQFVCLKDSIPNYSPGMFQSCIWAMTIAENVQNAKTVITIAEKEFQGVFSILEWILGKKDITVSLISDLNSFDLSEFGPVCLLLLSSTGKLDMDVLSLDYLSQVIICNDQFMDIFEDKPIKRIYLPATDTFSVQNISRKFKDAKMILKKMSRLKVLKRDCSVTYGDLINGGDIQESKSKFDNAFVRKNSSYIVVGGLTGLGWLLVKHLVMCCAKKIIIFSRRAPDEEMQRKIEGIKEVYHVQIVPIQVDICDLQSLSKVFLHLKSLCKDEPIRGIFHGAAVTADRFASEMTVQQFEVPLKSKVLGTMNLDHASRELELDFFVTHSSIAALLGNVGQCNYAAGNSFQDCFALLRKSRGLEATSIIWSALDVGLAADAFTRNALKSGGLIALNEKQILDSTNLAIQSGDIHRIFAHVDWRTFLQSSFIKSQKFKFKDFWDDSIIAISARQEERRHSEDVDENKLVQMVLRCLTSVFALHPSQISVSAPVVEFGLDSQKGTELANLIFERSHVRVPYIFLATDDHSAMDIANFVKSRQELGISNHEGNENTSVKLTFTQFMENILLTSSNVEYNEVHLIVTDIKINARMVQTSIQFLLHAYPELRTIFHSEIDIDGTKSLRKEIRGNEDAILQIELNGSERSFMASNERALHCDAFRAIILSKAKNTEIKLMFCPLLFDACSIVRIVEEVGNFIKYGSTNHRIHSNYSNEIRQPPMEDFFVLEVENVRRFWSSELRRQTHPFMLESRKSSTGVRWESMTIQDPVISALQKKLTQNDMSMYQAMCCFIQISVGIVTKASQVTILVQTDMRPSIVIKDLGTGMYSNLIPWIADLSNQKNISLHDFLSKSVRRLESIQSMVSFPFHMIKELPEFEESKHQNLLCTFIDESSINDYRCPVQIQEYRPGFSSVAKVELMIVSASQHMRLYFKSDENMFSTAVAVANCIRHLLDLYIHHDEISFGEAVRLTSEPNLFNGHTNGHTNGEYQNIQKP
ncbi:hypothetical protein FSP39_015820 [Pinctada imbricata]|uniref:Uncharacterized protein n=1 Tax=Pinctada imbricata TaxID=66713 RepID=A0AA88YIR5_PINIB|nr:hypothetical protein FSP39_015820 [Pinctada imbricata]